MDNKPFVILEEQVAKRKMMTFSASLIREMLCRCRGKCQRKDLEDVELEEYLGMAEIIAGVDKEQDYFHVEFPSQDNNLDFPEIWRIGDWKDSVERLTKMRALSEEARQQKFFLAEKTQELTHAIAQDTGLDESLAIGVARVIMSEQDQDLRRKKAKQFGVEL